MSHRCPAKGCWEDVPTSQLACKRHWFQLPQAMRNEVWDAYRSSGPGSGRHTDAVVAAIDWFNEHS